MLAHCLNVKLCDFTVSTGYNWITQNLEYILQMMDYLYLNSKIEINERICILIILNTLFSPEYFATGSFC